MKKVYLILLVISVVLAAGALAYSSQREIKAAWAGLVKNNREHYLSCQELPFYPQVEQALADHRDIAEQARQIPGVLAVRGQESRCASYDRAYYFIKGDIVVEYQSRQSRQAVEKLFGDSFFGIPYRGYAK
jgi:hypothetical protein